ncbi:MAG: ThiF family adenylyltransferase [Actinobacteria bacterium]|nr:ThiF family adenylyltransferase [Actinomycetota bacterium]
MHEPGKTLETSRYSRQELFEPIGSEGQAMLGKARVLIVGCGALGTVVADRLARAGVGHLRIVDRDFVELDNLQRQALFNEEHAIMRFPKAVAAEEVLKSVNSDIVIESVVRDVTPANMEELLLGCDLAMDATDNLETRFLLNDACVKTGTPWVHGAAVGSCGQEMPIIPGETACFRCFLVVPPGEPLQGCDVLGVLNTVTGIIADIQSTHAIRLLTGNHIADAKMTFVDIWENEFQQFAVARVPGCPCCAQGDYSFLNRKSTSWTSSLCGRNAVQITPAASAEIDLESLARDLSKVGRVMDNGYLLVFGIDGYEMTVFPTGRAIIKGTTDQQIARSLYSRYVGL